MKVSVFKNNRVTIPDGNISIKTALKRIKDGSSKEKVESKDKDGLVCVIFQGVFSKRGKDFLVEPSGFAILDWDHMKNDDNADQSSIDFRESLKEDEYIYSAWISPSGKGVKALVKIPKVSNDEEYKEYYNAILVSYPSLDPSNKDVSRMCYESYDPDIWVNENSKTWTQRFAPGGKVSDIAYNMIRSAKEGSRNETILRAGRLMGGYIAAGVVDEFDVLDRIEDLIHKIFPANEVPDEINTFRRGIEYGKLEPITPNDYVKRISKGDDVFDLNDHIAAPSSGWDRIEDYIDGKIERSIKTGVDPLDKYFALKKNTMYLYTSHKGKGKTVLMLFFMVLASITAKWRWIVATQENTIDDVKENLFHYLTHMKISVARVNHPELYRETQNYINRNFIFLKEIINFEQALDVSRHIVTSRPDEDFAVLIDPVNGFLSGYDWGNSPLNYESGTAISGKVRNFAMEYCTVFVTQHTIMSSQRDQFGKNIVRSVDGEGGYWLNRAAFAFSGIREKGTSTNYISVDNVRDKKTGGSETYDDNKIVIEWSPFDVDVYMEANPNKVWKNVLETIMRGRSFEVDTFDEKILSLRKENEVPF